MGLPKPLEPLEDSELPPLPPTNLYSDEPPMETHLHMMQLLVLLESLMWHWRDRDDYFASGNLTVYYSLDQVKTRDFRGPDFFVVRGVDPRPRRSWTVWEEGGRAPDVIVEVISETTEQNDRGPKKEIYERILRVPEYFIFDPVTEALDGFRLDGGRYRAIDADPDGRLASEQLELSLGVHGEQLRFFTPEGHLVRRGSEAALEERARAEEAYARAEEEHARAERLAAALRAAGIDPSFVE